VGVRGAGEGQGANVGAAHALGRPCCGVRVAVVVQAVGRDGDGGVDLVDLVVDRAVLVVVVGPAREAPGVAVVGAGVGMGRGGEGQGANVSVAHALGRAHGGVGVAVVVEAVRRDRDRGVDRVDLVVDRAVLVVVVGPAREAPGVAVVGAGVGMGGAGEGQAGAEVSVAHARGRPDGRVGVAVIRDAVRRDRDRR